MVYLDLRKEKQGGGRGREREPNPCQPESILTIEVDHDALRVLGHVEKLLLLRNLFVSGMTK